MGCCACTKSDASGDAEQDLLMQILEIWLGLV